MSHMLPRKRSEQFSLVYIAKGCLPPEIRGIILFTPTRVIQYIRADWRCSIGR